MSNNNITKFFGATIMENNEKRQYLFNVLKTTPDIVEYSIKTQDD